MARVLGVVAECKTTEVADLTARLEASLGKDREAVGGALDLAETAQDAAQAKQKAFSQLPAGGLSSTWRRAFPVSAALGPIAGAPGRTLCQPLSDQAAQQSR